MSHYKYWFTITDTHVYRLEYEPVYSTVNAVFTDSGRELQGAICSSEVTTYALSYVEVSLGSNLGFKSFAFACPFAPGQADCRGMNQRTAASSILQFLLSKSKH